MVEWKSDGEQALDLDIGKSHYWPVRLVAICLLLASAGDVTAQDAQVDYLRDFQTEAIVEGKTPVAHWGWEDDNYTRWTTHSNRLIPVYTYGTKTMIEGEKDALLRPRGTKRSKKLIKHTLTT